MKKKEFVKNKKADISISMLIFIVLGIAVLAVGTYLILKGGKLGKSAADCDGTCIASGQECAPGYYKTFLSCELIDKTKGRCCQKSPD